MINEIDAYVKVNKQYVPLLLKTLIRYVLLLIELQLVCLFLTYQLLHVLQCINSHDELLDDGCRLNLGQQKEFHISTIWL